MGVPSPSTALPRTVSSINAQLFISTVDLPVAWIFQIDSTLLVGSGVSVALVGGALPQNIVWVVAGAVTLGSTSTFQGILLGGTMAALNTGATVNGRLLVGTAVTLQAVTVNAPV